MAKYLKLTDIKEITYQTLWNIAKAILRRKFLDLKLLLGKKKCLKIIIKTSNLRH